MQNQNQYQFTENSIQDQDQDFCTPPPPNYSQDQAADSDLLLTTQINSDQSVSNQSMNQNQHNLDQQVEEDDPFLKQLDEETKYIYDYIKQNKQKQIDEQNIDTTTTVQNQEELYLMNAEYYLQNKYIIKVSFLEDIEEFMISGDKLIFIENYGVVSPKVIRDFRVLFNNDMNKLVRNCLKGQVTIERADDEEPITYIDFSEIHEYYKQNSIQFNDIQSLKYIQMRNNQSEFQVKHLIPNLQLSVIVNHDDEDYQKRVAAKLYQTQMTRLMRNDDVMNRVYEDVIDFNMVNYDKPIHRYYVISEKHERTLHDQNEELKSNKYYKSLQYIFESQMLNCLYITKIYEYLLRKRIFIVDNQLDDKIFQIQSHTGKLRISLESIDPDKFMIAKNQNIVQKQEALFMNQIIWYLEKIQIFCGNSNQIAEDKILQVLEELRNKAAMPASELCQFFAKLLVGRSTEVIDFCDYLIQNGEETKLYQVLLCTKFRNHITAIYNRAEDMFEDFDNQSSPYIFQQHFPSQLTDIFDDQLLCIYPRVYVTPQNVIDLNQSIELNEQDQRLFKKIIIMLIKYPPLRYLKHYFREYAFTMTKHLFELKNFREITQSFTTIQGLSQDQLIDLRMDVEFQVLGLYKIKMSNKDKAQVEVMEDIISILKLKIDKNRLSIQYYYYLMRDLWKENRIKQAQNAFNLLESYKNEDLSYQDALYILKAKCLLSEHMYYQYKNYIENPLCQYNFHNLHLSIEEYVSRHECLHHNPQVLQRINYLRALQYIFEKGELGNKLEHIQQIELEDKLSKSDIRSQILVGYIKNLNIEGIKSIIHAKQLLQSISTDKVDQKRRLLAYLAYIDLQNEYSDSDTEILEDMEDEFKEYSIILRSYIGFEIPEDVQEVVDKLILEEKSIQTVIRVFLQADVLRYRNFYYKALKKALGVKVEQDQDIKQEDDEDEDDFGNTFESRLDVLNKLLLIRIQNLRQKGKMQ
ncbi:UNKNOWN [Stylonychia lemnae]|uniref:Uncharacterized protein n=1 Tax=Stylonychia lemnae TaxID=5949 RepID=A0A078A5P9_STYLE|nr:UNKNOWN [Stylonychia lemnae]|eukprot:CDW77236.1 UNKNOWN [Stylonychia lemnae]